MPRLGPLLRRCTLCRETLPIERFARASDSHPHARCEACRAVFPGRTGKRPAKIPLEALRPVEGVEMGTAEIAEAMGCTRQNVEQVLASALRKLRKRAERSGLG